MPKQTADKDRMTIALPAQLRQRIDEIAVREHRSLTQQIIAMLEEGAAQRTSPRQPQPSDM